ncbi:hypothetical protein EI555_006476, partial [Monodon monoceros]
RRPGLTPRRGRNGNSLSRRLSRPVCPRRRRPPSPSGGEPPPPRRRAALAARPAARTVTAARTRAPRPRLAGHKAAPPARRRRRRHAHTWQSRPSRRSRARRGKARAWPRRGPPAALHDAAACVCAPVPAVPTRFAPRRSRVAAGKGLPEAAPREQRRGEGQARPRDPGERRRGQPTGPQKFLENGARAGGERSVGKGDPKKPRGKMSSYAFFVQTCREEHKRKHPDASVNFSEFSKKCSERWKTMSAKEKGKSEDMAEADKARYEREMKTSILPKGETKKKFKDPNAPKRPPSAFFLFCSECRPKLKGEHPGLSIGDEKTAAKLKEKCGKDIAANRAKGKPDAANKGVVKAEKSKKEEEEEEEDTDDDDE